MESSNKAVLKEKESLLEAINLLEETVQVLQRKGKKSENSAGIQTEIMRCEKCELPAFSVVDLVDHLLEFHPLSQLEQEVE